MRSCLVLGSGRSGTSMVAGVMAGAGYFMGEQLHSARSANPRGFFEDATINSLNEALLRTVAPPDLTEGQRWLSDLPADVVLPQVPGADPAIALLTAQAPFCFKDPRFSYTLPLWRPHLPADTGLICVFRHPSLTALSITEECKRAAYLAGVQMNPQRALGIWAAVYRRILAQQAGTQPWLFVHYDQVLSGAGVEAMAGFTGAALDASFPDRTMRRPPPELAVSDEIMALYAELCERAGFQPNAHAAQRARVSVVVLARTADDLPSVRADRGVEVQTIVVDRSDSQSLECPEATVVRSPGLSRGTAWALGAQACDAPFVALWPSGVHALPNHLARAVALLQSDPGLQMVTSNYHLPPDGDSFTATISLDEHGDAPPPGWIGGVVMRREVLSSIDQTAFYPGELALLRAHRAAGSLGHIAEPLYAYDASTFTRRQADVAGEAARLSTAPWSGDPLLTVSLCTYNRSAVLRESLACLCRQNLPAGSFRITVINDGSQDETAALLDGVSWPIPVQVIHRENGGLSAARNTGLEHTDTPLVLFINDDTIAPPDYIGTHLRAHSERPGFAVLGGFVQPPSETDIALTAAIESGNLMFCFGILEKDGDNPPQFFYTCNVSAPTAMVKAAGGFDVSFRHYGAEDTDMGLRLGLPVRYVPAATALHRHHYDFAYVQRRAVMVARAHIRLWRKHPDQCVSPDLSVAAARQALAERATQIATMEDAARSLSTVSLGALRRSGMSALVNSILNQLHALLNQLNRLWWLQGLADGLEEHGYTHMSELLAEHPLPVADGTVWVMSPSQGSNWIAVRDQFAALHPDATLALIADAPDGLSVEALCEACADFDSPESPALAIAQTGLPAGHDVRILAGAHGWIRCGGTQDARMARMASAAGCPEIHLNQLLRGA